MVGNGWHWGVASRLLGLLVMATWAKLVASGTSPAPAPRQGTIKWLSQFWARRGWDLAPPPRSEPQVLGEGLDEESHWAAAARMQDSLVGWPTWNRPWRPSWSSAGIGATTWCASGGDVLEELQRWWRTPLMTRPPLDALPDHVRATYVTKDRPRPFQGPVLDRLLRGVGYHAADDLRQDVDTGFDMLGQVRSARGWRRRSDERYARPEGLDRLRRENPTYVARKAARRRDQEHTRALLDELVAETRLGRVTGPCAAPNHWSVSTVALPSVADMGVLRQPPPGDCFAALSFAICQVYENGELKLRRGEAGADPATTPPWGRLTSRPTTSWGTSSTSSFAPGLRGGTRWCSAMTSRTPIASGRCATPGIVAPFSPRLRA